MEKTPREFTMSLLGNIEHIVHSSGIEAALVRSSDRTDTFAGAETWSGTLAKALDVFSLSGESSVRIVVGKHTLVIQRERDEEVAVALPTGHPMAKSLRRMLRRMARKDRGPLVHVTPPSPTLAAAPTPPSTTERLTNLGGAEDDRSHRAAFSF
ncbi:MAG: hypothetical protein ACPHRO_08630 [Nannocystaceae bacterium]